MYNFKSELVSLLDEILPTYYELFVDSSTETPCITYIESNNTADKEGDTLRYSNLSYNIKLWGNDYAELTDYASQVDKALYAIGFKRTFSEELTYGTQIQLIFTYQAMAVENI